MNNKKSLTRQYVELASAFTLEAQMQPHCDLHSHRIAVISETEMEHRILCADADFNAYELRQRFEINHAAMAIKADNIEAYRHNKLITIPA